MKDFDKEFNGDLGTAFKEMIHNDTDCCEVIYTLGDTQITAEIVITKVVVKDEVVYDAFEDDDPYGDELDNCKPDEILH